MTSMPIPVAVEQPVKKSPLNNSMSRLGSTRTDTGLNRFARYLAQANQEKNRVVTCGKPEAELPPNQLTGRGANKKEGAAQENRATNIITGEKAPPGKTPLKTEPLKDNTGAEKGNPPYSGGTGEEILEKGTGEEMRGENYGCPEELVMLPTIAVTGEIPTEEVKSSGSDNSTDSRGSRVAADLTMDKPAAEGTSGFLNEKLTAGVPVGETHLQPEKPGNQMDTEGERHLPGEKPANLETVGQTNHLPEKPEESALAPTNSQKNLVAGEAMLTGQFADHNYPENDQPGPQLTKTGVTEEAGEQVNQEKASQAGTDKKGPVNPNPQDINFKIALKAAGSTRTDATKDEAAIDVKKIIDLESQRLNNGKTPAASVKTDEPKVIAPVEETARINPTAARADMEVVKEIPPDIRTDNPATTRAPVEPKEIISQIIKKAELMLKLDSSEMKIHLKPEFLGKMLIRVGVVDGIVTARFITESQHVKQVLEANMNSLRQTLEASGIKVEKTEVSVQLYNDGNFDGSSGERQTMWADHQGLGGNHGGSYQLGRDSDYLLLDEEQQITTGGEPSQAGISSDGRVDFII